MVKLASLTLFFALTALIYASVGFGGGSTYTALLVAAGTDYNLIPIIALSCNIAVVSGNTYRYSKAGLVPWRKLWPILLLSIPMAWIGGRLNIPETLFIALLALALFFSGIRLILQKTNEAAETIKNTSDIRSALLGGVIGFYSGVVGIGGGIFLAPILYSLNWGRAKTIAAACSVFILFNSLSGFAGQLMKLTDTGEITEALTYWPLLPAVLLGGFIGNSLGVNKIPQIWIRRLTGILVLLVAARLGVDLLGRVSA